MSLGRIKLQFYFRTLVGHVKWQSWADKFSREWRACWGSVPEARTSMRGWGWHRCGQRTTTRCSRSPDGQLAAST